MVARLGIRSLHLGGEKVQPQLILSSEKFLETVPIADIDKLPVVKTSPFQVLVIGGKTQGADQMQDRVRGPAQPGDAPGVGGNLRLDQDDMKRGRAGQESVFRFAIKRRALVLPFDKLRATEMDFRAWRSGYPGSPPRFSQP